jgi:hypothetical protein
MSTAEAEAAETVGKRTCAALTAGLGPTAAVPRTGAGRRIIARMRHFSRSDTGAPQPRRTAVLSVL